jgi:hypothetical protein
MTCDDSLNLLSARLDAELAPEDRLRLDAHLAQCATCSATAEALALQDAHLRHAFDGHRRDAADLAERIIAQLPHRRSSWRISWFTAILSAAAGFAIAYALFHRPPQPSAPNTPQIVHSTSQPTSQPISKPPAVAQLALATGAVEFCCPGDNGRWSAMPTGGDLPAGASVRTPKDVRCELRTADGSEVRLNGGTEIELRSPRQFKVATGEVWSSVAHSPEPFVASAQDATFTALGTQFDLQSTAKLATCTVAEGSVRVSCPSGQDTLNAGQQLTVSDGRLGDKSANRDLALATRWVNEILVMKGRDNPELHRRIDDLFARIGEEKMSFLYEEEIRGLGDHCVVPLTRYIESPRSQGHAEKRAIAARIISDVAPPWGVPYLIELLNDPQGDVRASAAAALQRLTGKAMDRTAQQWRAEDVMACQPTINRWLEWWNENRQRYPGAPTLVEPPYDRKARDGEDPQQPLRKT